MEKVFCLALLLGYSISGISQGVRISEAPGEPDPSAVLDLNSTSQGLLSPRMTTAQRNAIPNPAPGLQIYNTDVNCLQFYNGGQWICAGCIPASPTAALPILSGQQIVWNWNAVQDAEGYKWNTVNDYTTANDVSNATTATQSGLLFSTTYSIYVWSYHACGGRSQDPLRLTAQTTANPCVLGQIGPGGGRIFYCGNAYPGFMGLEAAPSDQSAGAPWGCDGTSIGVSSQSVGSGLNNTNQIVNNCGESGSAAQLCADLDQSGFSDWFLPSSGELNLMYNQLHLQSLGGFTGALYWGSSEHSINPSIAWAIHFGSFSNYSGLKTESLRVRCIRRF